MHKSFKDMFKLAALLGGKKKKSRGGGGRHAKTAIL